MLGSDTGSKEKRKGKGLWLGKDANVALVPAWEILLAVPKSPGDGEEPVWPQSHCKWH